MQALMIMQWHFLHDKSLGADWAQIIGENWVIIVGARTFELFHITLLGQMLAANNDHEWSTISIQTLNKCFFSSQLIGYLGLHNEALGHKLIPPFAMLCKHLSRFMQIQIARNQKPHQRRTLHLPRFPLRLIDKYYWLNDLNYKKNQCYNYNLCLCLLCTTFPWPTFRNSRLDSISKAEFTFLI